MSMYYNIKENMKTGNVMMYLSKYLIQKTCYQLEKMSIETQSLTIHRYRYYTTRATKHDKLCEEKLNNAKQASDDKLLDLKILTILILRCV